MRPSKPHALLARVARPEDVERIRAALERAGIPHETGLLDEQPPEVFFTVPSELELEARAVVSALTRAPTPAIVRPLRAPASPPAEHEAPDPPHELTPARFPRNELRPALGVVALHVGIVCWMLAGLPPGRELLRLGGLAVGGTLLEPWRLVTSLFLHSGLPHALWNGLSMVVFSVPLIQVLGRRRVAAVYMAAGIGGALAAVLVGVPGTLIVGSSGAVAGLFGAWVSLRLQLSRLAELETRERVRTWGIALLVLPALITPVTSSGQNVSVSSHLGGLLTGVVIGVVLGRRMLPAVEDPASPPLSGQTPGSGWADR